jgi:hypothetical protein
MPEAKQLSLSGLVRLPHKICKEALIQTLEGTLREYRWDKSDLYLMLSVGEVGLGTDS